MRRLPVELLAGAGVVAILLLVALGRADAWSQAGAIDLLHRLSPPGGADRPAGSDQLGRDLLARIIVGAPWSLGVAAGATSLALALGACLGLAAAESGRRARAVILQVTNLALSFPGLVAAVAAVAVLGQGAITLILVLGLLTWALFARVVYAEALAVRTRDYVAAARIGGVRSPVILWRHVLPALTPSLIAMTVFHFADMLVAASALSFLGVGAPLGAPAWGAMLAESRPYLYQAPWLLIGPAVALAASVLALNLLGDGLAKMLSTSGRR